MANDPIQMISEVRWKTWQEQMYRLGYAPIFAVGVDIHVQAGTEGYAIFTPPELSGDLVRILRTLADRLDKPQQGDYQRLLLPAVPT